MPHSFPTRRSSDLADGSGRIEAWTQLRGHRVAAVTADVQLQDLWLQGAPLAKGETPPRIDVGGLQLQARWQQIDSGWRLDAPRLRIGGDDGDDGESGGAQSLDRSEEHTSALQSLMR